MLNACERINNAERVEHMQSYQQCGKGQHRGHLELTDCFVDEAKSTNLTCETRTRRKALDVVRRGRCGVLGSREGGEGGVLKVSDVFRQASGWFAGRVVDQ